MFKIWSFFKFLGYFINLFYKSGIGLSFREISCKNWVSVKISDQIKWSFHFSYSFKFHIDTPKIDVTHVTCNFGVIMIQTIKPCLLCSVSHISDLKINWNIAKI